MTNADASPARVRRTRAATYLRVSTGRQAEGEVSIPSQREHVKQFCDGSQYDIVDEYVEPGASAWSGGRPVFDEMLERAYDDDHPYDVIVVYSFSRFYRDGVEMELEIRKLRKRKIEVVSVTQPSGSDPTMDLIRQIFGVIDGYTSHETSKHVKRSMKENAKQGFYNGSPLPLGLISVEAERRGDKIKKKIGIDKEREQDVRDIFRLYVDGDPATNTPPLGTAALAAWLNEKGYRTAEGKAFSIAAVGRILSNTAYIGKYLYNRTDSRTRERKDPSEIVVIPCPPIIDDETFERARTKAQENHPKQLSSRSSSSPTLLSRLAICGHCGGWMQKSPGTGALGGTYSYYACSTRVKKGKSECPGVRIRMDYLDDEVARLASTKLCTQHRLTELLGGLYHRLSASAAKISASLAAAEKELNEWDERLRRLHRSIEEGVVPLDEVLRERVAEIATQRETAKKNVQRLQKQLIPPQVIDAGKIEIFSNTFKERLKDGNPILRRNYLKSVIGAVIVEPTKVRIVGDKCQLAECVGAFSFAPKKVQSFATNWRARKDSNL